MKFKPFIILFFVFAVFSCKNEHHNLIKIEGKQIPITDSLNSNTEVETYVKPFREHVENDLDNVLSYSIKTYSKRNGEFNTAIGNFMADAVYEEANPVFKNRTGKDIDMVILNYGGIRSIISKGDITSRTAYEIMPFENSIVVVALNGKNINALVDYLIRAKRAHPISKLKLTVDKDFNV
ncbi:MAG TPA: 5'-nucleotidase C-terminal domain-containing protein, partial [Flavobacteriaceae bacterium]|nr:5'-nucleotidase C-terminal domain-containing protein [Flavobacteriaceae bacterium]